MIIILMGVAGCGKTSVGKALSKETGIPFYDGDDFHSEANKKKMKGGKPLTDTDRKPWLKDLADFMMAHGEMILACSALKRSYRRILRVSPEIHFIYLKGDYTLFRQRLQERQDHFFNPILLDSQFADLEEPRHAFIIDATLPVTAIVEAIKKNMNYKSDLYRS